MNAAPFGFYCVNFRSFPLHFTSFCEMSGSGTEIDRPYQPAPARPSFHSSCRCCPFRSFRTVFIHSVHFTVRHSLIQSIALIGHLHSIYIHLVPFNRTFLPLVAFHFTFTQLIHSPYGSFITFVSLIRQINSNSFHSCSLRSVSARSVSHFITFIDLL